jgi:hypothetical protein
MLNNIIFIHSTAAPPQNPKVLTTGTVMRTINNWTTILPIYCLRTDPAAIVFFLKTKPIARNKAAPASAALKECILYKEY